MSLNARALVGAALALSLLATTPREAQAQDLPAVNVQQFRLAPGPADYLTVYSSGLTPHLDWTAGFFLNFADAPLRQPGAGSLDTEVVDFQVAGDLIASFGIYNVVELGLAMPITLLQQSDDLTPLDINAGNQDLSAAGLGDLRLNAKVEILNLLEGFGLAFVTVIYAPTGDSESFNGDGNVTAEARLAGDAMLPYGIRFGANFGYRFRPEGRRIRDAFVGNELPWGVSGVLPLFSEDLDALVEINGAIPTGSGPAEEVSSGAVPAELLGALRFGVTDDWTLTAGLGTRISEGYGSPNARVFVGFGGHWVTGGKYHWDYDFDGFIGLKDQCPDLPEDLDGYLDTDGCPDPDNDGDGIPDSRDKCPNAGIGDAGIAEIGADGCPDNDIDGDNIFNDKDKCPEDPEDYDRFEDQDGCPDIDNDNDGIPDVRDSCPDTAETVDGIVDDDGCPELEDQKVIVTKGKIEILQQVYFDTGKATIKDESFEILDAVVDVMRRNTDIALLQIQGHTDDRGNDNANLRLSQRRAGAVLDYIVDKGIDTERLSSVGYGEQTPIDDNKTRAGRTRNRRVEFHILKRTKKGETKPRFDTSDDDPLGLDNEDPF